MREAYEPMEIEEIFPHLPLRTRALLLARGLHPHIHPRHLLRAAIPSLAAYLILASQPGPLGALGLLAAALGALASELAVEAYLGMSDAMAYDATCFSGFDKLSALLLPAAVALPIHWLGWAERPATGVARWLVAVGCAVVCLALWAALRALAAMAPVWIRDAKERRRRRAEARAAMTPDERARASIAYRLRRLALQEVRDPEQIQRLRRLAVGAGARAGAPGPGPRRI